MSVDYDLAIVGGTLPGRWAALKAAQMGARVVLTERPNQIAERITAWAIPDDGSSSSPTAQPSSTELPSDPIPAELTASGLAVNGVDVVWGQPVFETVDPPLLKIKDRTITARRGLLAMPGVAQRYNLPGLGDSLTLTPAELEGAPLPKKIALLGEQAATVEWAIALLQRGVDVTLLLPSQRLLPAEDIDVQRLVSAQLRALGVNLAIDPQFTETGTQLQIHSATNSDAYVVDRVVLTDLAPPNLSALQLPDFKTTGPVRVNAHLQTEHPSLYAAGPVLGGEDRLSLFQAEVAAAVENALFWHRRAIRYDRVHYCLAALTPIGHAGLTEQQARRYYETVEVYQSGAQGTLTYGVDFCKAVMADGKLVGLHLMGEGADFAIALLAPYLGQSPMRLIRALIGMDLTRGLAVQIDKALAQYRAQQWHPGTWRRDWAENWFNWRRSR